MRLLVAALLSPAALIRLPGRTWVYLAAYLAASAAVFYGVYELLLSREGELKALALHYLFPDSWDFAAEFVIDRFFAAQHKVILVNALTTVALVVVSLLLFWLKEMVSASFEEGAGLVPESGKELPLLEQGWQEVKLFLFVIAAQGTIFWIGYRPEPSFRTAASVLSYGFLFLTFAIDFISPVLQRHGGHYSRVLKTLVLHAPASLVFGAIFAAPSILVGVLWHSHPEWSLAQASSYILAANLLSMAWACVAGTWLGSRMFSSFKKRGRSGPLARVVAWVVVGGALVANLYAFGSIALAIHHKSQILECEYDVVWSSFGFEKPGLSDLLRDEISVGFHIDVDIKNPTEFDVSIEDNRLKIEHQGKEVAETRISPFEVPAGETRRETIGFEVKMAPSMLRQGLALLDKATWRMTLYVQVAPGFELPIYLLGYP